MRLIVTRPRAQADALVAELRVEGVDAVALPLIDIAPVADPQPLREAWASLGTCALAMFVSANAVQHFMRLRPPAAGWPPQLLAGHVIMGVAMIGLGVARSMGAIGFLLVVSGLMSGHAYTNSLFHGVSGSYDRTFRMAVHEILLSTGAVSGAVLGGLVYQHFGLLPACLLAAGVMVPAVLADLNWWKAAGRP